MGDDCWYFVKFFYEILRHYLLESGADFFFGFVVVAGGVLRYFDGIPFALSSSSVVQPSGYSIARYFSS